jgi:hypothetical protein
MICGTCCVTRSRRRSFLPAIEFTQCQKERKFDGFPSLIDVRDSDCCFSFLFDLDGLSAYFTRLPSSTARVSRPRQTATQRRPKAHVQY